MYFSCATLRMEGGNYLGLPTTVLNLYPGENSLRNREGDFIKFNAGRLLFIYSHFYSDSPSDFGHAFLASRESSDNGETWSQIDKIEISDILKEELNLLPYGKE